MLTLDTVEVALAVAAVSATVTRSSFARDARAHVETRWKWGVKLLNCPYCLAHWFAAVGALTLPQTSFGNFVINVFAIVAMAAVVIGISFKLLHMSEYEIDNLEEQIEELREEKEDLNIDLRSALETLREIGREEAARRKE